MHHTAWFGRERHAMKPHPRPVGGGWLVPVTVCGLIVPAGTDASDTPPTCIRCRDLTRPEARP